ncbi:MAG: chemotaxis-specific protein-glutamate methyltransferase CheB [Edaphobacter sp.]|uniref:chemotaxis-specific protein-glutamate methyltransferase CheB n=1 Tax=Edaphobacter sp. TaxID=1934404 RepID=UPI0023A62B41|nr:chemotaxis-specific protein-glutamate methyltransferase CheB [Edaphobacter sp.]MDE1174994.1 chemotaxis-specific protein-glutamate methyltransferase CheB [Edaphobacter sp.]
MGVFKERTLRVLAADDSAVMRGIMRTLFMRHGESRGELPRMELAGIARDGMECLEEIAKLAPDVLVLDLEMPRMDGLEVLDRLRAIRSKVPVIMCSSHTERGARATLDALARGASDYVMKPTGHHDFESALASLSQQLLPRIAALASNSLRQSKVPGAIPLNEPTGAIVRRESCSAVEVVVIGVSTGGPAALEQLLPQLPEDFPVPVLVVQHMPKLFTGVLAERLNRFCRLKVVEASHGVPLCAGAVLLAPGDAHMEIMPKAVTRPGSLEVVRGFAAKLHYQEPLNHCRPSVDYLFHSAARLYGAGTLALVLTGMGSDGLEGAHAIAAAGGTVLAQDEMSSAVWGMPGRIAESGIAAAVLPLSVIGREITQRVKRSRKGRSLPGVDIAEKPQRSPEVVHGLL